MNTKNLLIFIFAFILICSNVSFSQSKDIRKKRFFGFHFDFHATRDDKDIGKGINENDIEHFLSLTKPDFVQVDTKGIYGISSYPTIIGFTAVPYEKDIMEIWKRITTKYGVDLYSHYCTIMDVEAVKNFPHWARIKSDNNIDSSKISIFSNYRDSLFIPQIKELIDKYNIDGIWVDADVWALEPEYGQNVLELFKTKTGIHNIPVKDDKTKYDKYIEFLRTAYIEYAREYVNKIHNYNPDFRIGINWAYSKMMPEKMEMDVDYLSADLSEKNWIYDAAFNSRLFASYNKPWDLMSWSFADNKIKPKILLLLEAAEILSMGGGFQSYWIQKRNGSIYNTHFTLMKEISNFCRDREPYCFETEIIPQIGIFFSRETWKSNTQTIYNNGGNESIEGLTSLILDAGGSAEIIMEHDVHRINSYPLIIIPETSIMNSGLKSMFVEYVNNGGSLFVVGVKAVNNFKSELGVSFSYAYDTREYFLSDGASVQSFNLPYQSVSVTNNTRILYNSYFNDRKNKVFSPFLTIKKMGKGKIAGLYSDIGMYYLKEDSYLLCNIIKNVIDSLFPGKIVTSDADSKVHIVTTKIDKDYFLQLINLGDLKPGMEADYYAQLQPIKNLKLKINTVQKPDKIILQPAGEELAFDYDDQHISVMIPKIYIYSILQIAN